MKTHSSTKGGRKQGEKVSPDFSSEKLLVLWISVCSSAASVKESRKFNQAERQLRWCIKLER